VIVFLFNIFLFSVNCFFITLRFKWNPGSFQRSFTSPSESLFVPACVSAFFHPELKAILTEPRSFRKPFRPGSIERRLMRMQNRHNSHQYVSIWHSSNRTMVSNCHAGLFLGILLVERDCKLRDVPYHMVHSVSSHTTSICVQLSDAATELSLYTQ
jgi:hypothetical protein